MTSCQRHWIPDPDTFNAFGYNWNAIQRVGDADLKAIPEGAQLPSSKVQQPTLADLDAQLAQLQQLKEQISQRMLALLQAEQSAPQLTSQQQQQAEQMLQQLKIQLYSVTENISTVQSQINQAKQANKSNMP